MLGRRLVVNVARRTTLPTSSAGVGQASQRQHMLHHAIKTSQQSSRMSTTASTSAIAATRNSSVSSGGSRSSRGYRRVGGGLAAIAGIGGMAAYGAYRLNTTEEDRLGINRQIQFWTTVFPIVFDYTWYTHSKSPYTWYQKQMLQSGRQDEDGDADESKTEEALSKKRKQQLLQELHMKHAPSMLNIMLELKGLYIKLGQVLSVTALPIPDAYREKFKILQSEVSGWEDFDTVVKPILEKELLSKDGEFKATSLDDIFEYIDPIPCGAASIGQAHRAILAKKENNENSDKEEVIIKVQYPNATWQVPADIQCIGQFMKLCVYFNVVDESSANLSYEEFSRQFLAELDYTKEKENLQRIYNSSIDTIGNGDSNETNPYTKYGVLVPNVYDEFCTSHIITMEYFPGPKLQEEAKRRLAQLGIDASRGGAGGRGGLRALVEKDYNKNNDINNSNTSDNQTDQEIQGEERQQHQPMFMRDPATTEDDTTANIDKDGTAVTTNTSTMANGDQSTAPSSTMVVRSSSSWKMDIPQLIGRVVGVDSMLWATR